MLGRGGRGGGSAYPAAVLVRRVVLLLLVLVVAVVCAYVYGRFTCLPPQWWIRVFAPSGDYACVQ